MSDETRSESPELQIADSSELDLRDPEAIVAEEDHPSVQAAEAPDAELAKRPWLLDKLMGQESEPSVKMDPPKPAANPPSLRNLNPPPRETKLSRQDVSDRRIDQMPPQELAIEDALEASPLDFAKPKSLNKGTPQPSDSQVGDLQPTVPENQVDPLASQTELDYTGYPKSAIRLTRNAYQMRNQMRQTLRSYYSEMEIANERSNWGMMHAMMVYGIDTKVRVGRKTYSTIAWIAGNNTCRGQEILAEKDGEIFVKSGVGLQGHQGQLLAVFSICDVPADYPLYADSQKYSVSHLIEQEKQNCKSGEELTFTLIGLSHYLDTDAIWTDRAGETWDFERLIQEELAQPIVGAACGGTHRLMGFAHALRKRRAEGKPITGQWLRAEEFTKDFVQYAYRLQNRDGSFSTDWFEGRENNGKIDRQVQTTGHIVEWLLTVTPNSELQNPRLVSAVKFLLSSMYKERKHEWSIGPKGHALRSLAMYYDRVYQDPPPWRQKTQVARRRQTRR